MHYLKPQEKTAVSGEGADSGGYIIQLNEEVIRDHLGQIVRGPVEETLNQLLEAKADRLRQAKKYQ